VNSPTLGGIIEFQEKVQVASAIGCSPNNSLHGYLVRHLHRLILWCILRLRRCDRYSVVHVRFHSARIQRLVASLPKTGPL